MIFLPTEKQLPIDELFKKLPVIQNALTKYHAHDMFKYFKSNVSSRKLTNEEATERIQDHIATNVLVYSKVFLCSIKIDFVLLIICLKLSFSAFKSLYLKFN